MMNFSEFFIFNSQLSTFNFFPIFASAKGALTNRCVTRGEKGIRCESGTIPVAVSPTLYEFVCRILCH